MHRSAHIRTRRKRRTADATDWRASLRRSGGWRTDRPDNAVADNYATHKHPATRLEICGPLGPGARQIRIGQGFVLVGKKQHDVADFGLRLQRLQRVAGQATADPLLHSLDGAEWVDVPCPILKIRGGSVEGPRGSPGRPPTPGYVRRRRARGRQRAGLPAWVGQGGSALAEQLPAEPGRGLHRVALGDEGPSSAIALPSSKASTPWRNSTLERNAPWPSSR